MQEFILERAILQVFTYRPYVWGAALALLALVAVLAIDSLILDERWWAPVVGAVAVGVAIALRYSFPPTARLWLAGLMSVLALAFFAVAVSIRTADRP